MSESCAVLAMATQDLAPRMDVDKLTSLSSTRTWPRTSWSISSGETERWDVVVLQIAAALPA
jgi:hypothetical protein